MEIVVAWRGGFDLVGGVCPCRGGVAGANEVGELPDYRKYPKCPHCNRRPSIGKYCSICQDEINKRRVAEFNRKSKR